MLTEQNVSRNVCYLFFFVCTHMCCNEIGQWCHVLFLPCYILLLHGYVYDALTCLMKVPFSASQSLQPIEIKLAKCACVPLHSQQCKGHSRERHTLFTAIPNRTERV